MKYWLLVTNSILTSHLWKGTIPDSKAYGANIGPTRDQQDPGVPHVGPMNLAIWDVVQALVCSSSTTVCTVLFVKWRLAMWLMLAEGFGFVDIGAYWWSV